MPTGYTADLVEGDQSFEDFALQCARAFGACMHQRDAPSGDKPTVPEKTESYALTALVKARDAWNAAKAMTLKEAHEQALEEYTNRRAEYINAIEKKRVVRDRVNLMLVKANEYVPPTEEHIGHKNFMIEQLQSTFDHDGNDDYYVRNLRDHKLLTPDEHRDQLIEFADNDIKYYANKVVEESKRENTQGSWLLDLYKALGVEYTS